MNKPREITILDSAKNRARVRKGFYISLLILMVVEFFIPKQGQLPWEEAYGFYAVYGFIGCVSLIFIAKGLRWWVMRKEDYYD